MIPKTKGYTCIVKIAESALDGDTKKAKHYIKKYMIMYPESDLIYPFTHLLAGEKNPDKLTISNSDGDYSPIAKLVWSYLKYTECDVNGEHTTLIEAKEIWDMIKALEAHIHDELMRLKKLARVFNSEHQQQLTREEKPTLNAKNAFEAGVIYATGSKGETSLWSNYVMTGFNKWISKIIQKQNESTLPDETKDKEEV